MSDEKLRALPRDVPDYHARQAAHLRALAENATTARLKARLIDEAIAARLTQLDIGGNFLIDPPALAALAESPYLPPTLELDTDGLLPDEPTRRRLRQRLGRRWPE